MKGEKEIKEKEKEKTMEENLKDPSFVNFNIISKLEEIKRINYAILEILNEFYQKLIHKAEPVKDKEGVFKPN